MSLTALIDKHKTSLVVSQGEGYEHFLVRFRDFGSELVRLTPFTYTKEDMRTTVAHMIDAGFTVYSRYNVVAYAMRRAALETVQDESTREDLFRIWDLVLVNMGDDTKAGGALKELVEKIGKPQVEGYLSKVQEGFQGIEVEIKAANQLAIIAYQEARLGKIDERTMRIADQTAENHNARIPIEHDYVMNHVILKLLRML